MPTYRAYLLGHDGHFVDRLDIEAPDDNAAIETIRQHAGGRAIEVWQRDRMVTKVNPARGMPGNLFKLFRKRKSDKRDQ